MYFITDSRANIKKKNIVPYTGNVDTKLQKKAVDYNE